LYLNQQKWNYLHEN